MTASNRVVQLTTVHHPYDPRIYHKECKSLQKAGFEVFLLAKEDKNSERKEVPIKHIKLKSYTSRLKRMTIGALAAYKQAKKLNADVYHFHDPELLPVGWLLKNKSNHVIYDIHEDYITSIMQKDYMSRPIRKLIAFTYKTMERFFSKNMELCLAEKYYQDIYPTGKCILNYPTINQKISEHHRTGTPEYKLLYTGNVTLDRGALIHARIPVIDERMEVYYVGKCPNQLAEQIYNKAATRKDNIQIEGIDQFVEKEDIEERYLQHNWLAGIALFPPTEHYMKKELTKFFEYMNAGIPVICSNFPVWENFINKHQCGITVDPYNDQEIKDAISYLVENPDKAEEMGANGKKAVQNELNWEVEENKLKTWYADLLRSNQGERDGDSNGI
ncbi:glycosyltransferase (capsular polysaccharide synthesis) [Oceanobacillus iheyensis HTE831]|uniref:Glycosyltransferase (Capsular polysaccharide synthesis) n=1 Tax=Oceanobacillus iheyensis (strain DSM 14371 / CIP 107618 / JCM 11309 / KCTC 3954 / HTE831) TaxID=221109 RepID=Q8CX81_OCEIH|nr:glycosyltransferase [Oceanobacillus iheyensis]BAC14882.1 glycosyltransferase (capsular polysaccharide synthesis) [Oceanobacillus iheyensis HTE831]